ncbi:cupredoxin domain-containing protein [Nitrososphaera sp.]|uniref:cupredoxin domain-containing protein n=1 Tax=Nitrososphaera sp. TaxID=1971748 RepID=UPI002EDBAF31
MTEHEHGEEPVVLTSPGRMARGIIIVAVTLAIGAAVVVTQFENFFSNAPPVTRLQTGPPPPPPPPAAGVTTIAILAGAAGQGNPDYDPDDDATVPMGNKVVWINHDNVPHTATSGTGTDDQDSGVLFDTGIVNDGESSDEIEIDGEVGDTIPYYCFIHPYMISQLTIVEAEEGGGSGPTLTILLGSSVQGNPDYNPDPMTVTAGDVITVFNADNIPHTVTSGTGPSDPDTGALFDSSILNGGDTATINTAGLGAREYDYYCIIHSYMTGKLQVTE